MPTPYRDVFRYVNTGTAQEHGRGDQAHAVVNNSDLSDEDFYAQLQALQPETSFDYSRGRTAQGDLSNDWSIREGSFLDRIGDEHGAVNFGASPYSEGSPGSGRHLSIDATKLPQTRFGGIDRVAAVDQGTSLINPNLVYDDPNYGRITDLRNIKGQDEVGQALMMAATMGLGAITGPAMAAAIRGVQGVRGAMGGNLGGLVGAGLGMIPGVSPLLASAIRMGMNQISQGDKP